MATIVPIAVSSWASVRSARAVSRSREIPSGTDGGRKQPTASPAARQSAAQRTAASGEGADRDHRGVRPDRGQPRRGEPVVQLPGDLTGPGGALRFAAQQP